MSYIARNAAKKIRPYGEILSRNVLPKGYKRIEPYGDDDDTKQPQKLRVQVPEFIKLRDADLEQQKQINEYYFPKHNHISALQRKYNMLYELGYYRPVPGADVGSTIGSYNDVYKYSIFIDLLDHITSEYSSPITYINPFINSIKYDISHSYTRGLGIDSAYFMNKALALQAKKDAKFRKNFFFTSLIQQCRIINSTNNHNVDNNKNIYSFNNAYDYNHDEDNERGFLNKYNSLPKLKDYFRYFPGYLPIVRSHLRTHDKIIIFENNQQYVNDIKTFVGNDRRFNIMNYNVYYKGEEDNTRITDKIRELQANNQPIDPDDLVNYVDSYGNKLTKEQISAINGSNKEYKPLTEERLKAIVGQLKLLHQQRILNSYDYEVTAIELDYYIQQLYNDKIAAEYSSKDKLLSTWLYDRLDAIKSELRHLENDELPPTFKNSLYTQEQDDDIDDDIDDNETNNDNSNLEGSGIEQQVNDQNITVTDDNSNDIQISDDIKSIADINDYDEFVNAIEQLNDDDYDLLTRYITQAYSRLVDEYSEQKDNLSDIELRNFDELLSMTDSKIQILTNNNSTESDDELDIDTEQYDTMLKDTQQQVHKLQYFIDQYSNDIIEHEEYKFSNDNELQTIIQSRIIPYKQPTPYQYHDAINSISKLTTSKSFIHIDIGQHESYDSVTRQFEHVNTHILPSLLSNNPTALYYITYPIYGRNYPDELLTTVTSFGIQSVLHGYYFPRTPCTRHYSDVSGTGLIIINPPLYYEDKLKSAERWMDMVVESAQRYDGTDGLANQSDIMKRLRNKYLKDSNSELEQQIKNALEDTYYRPSRPTAVYLTEKDQGYKNNVGDRFNQHYETIDFSEFNATTQKKKLRELRQEERRRKGRARRGYNVVEQTSEEFMHNEIGTVPTWRFMKGSLPHIPGYRRRTKAEIDEKQKRQAEQEERRRMELVKKKQQEKLQKLKNNIS